MNSALSDIAVTIASPLFSLALFLIAMRFLAQLCGVSPYNPISTGPSQHYRSHRCANKQAGSSR
jgi:hypothetical protein